MLYKRGRPVSQCRAHPPLCMDPIDHTISRRIEVTLTLQVEGQISSQDGDQIKLSFVYLKALNEANHLVVSNLKQHVEPLSYTRSKFK